MSEPQSRLVDPADCIGTEDADPASRPDIDFLMASLEQKQNVPVLLAPHPDQPGKYQILDGNGRVYCLGRLGRKVLAIILPGPVSEVERIEFTFATNLIRRTMSLEEIAYEASRYIELTGCTQGEAAKRLKCSDATISRALSLIRRIPPEFRDAARKIGPSVVSIITPLTDAEKLRQALDFAVTPGPEGRKPTREMVSRLVSELRGKQPSKPPKVRRVKLHVKDRRFEVELKPDDTAQTLIEAFKAMLDRLQKHRELPLAAVAAALANKEPVTV